MHLFDICSCDLFHYWLSLDVIHENGPRLFYGAIIHLLSFNKLELPTILISNNKAAYTIGVHSLLCKNK